MAGAPGRVAEIRRAQSSDLTALGDFFAGLSARTRTRRFFAPVTPTSAMLRRLSGGPGNVDAVVAIAGGGIVGHAMAADRAGSDGDSITEIGVVVADAWQGRGVGSALVRALIASAQARGVTFLVMDVLPGNRQVLAMILGHWADAGIDYATDCLTVRVGIPRHRHQHQRPHAAPGPRAPATTRPGGRPAACPVARLPARRPAALSGLPSANRESLTHRLPPADW
jgi:L-amino acid N-acyltransferase YncA